MGTAPERSLSKCFTAVKRVLQKQEIQRNIDEQEHHVSEKKAGVLLQRNDYQKKTKDVNLKKGSPPKNKMASQDHPRLLNQNH